MALRSIEDEWREFVEKVFANQRLSDTQVSEMKKAFFAGAWSVFTAVLQLGEPHFSDEEAAEYLDARGVEFEAFKKRLVEMLDEHAERN